MNHAMNPATSKDAPSSIVLPKLILGLSLIAVGLIYSLDRLGYVDARNLLDYWPVILVAVGVAKIVQPGRGRFAGLILTIVGLVILGENLRLMDFEAEDLFPLIFVLIGLRIAWHALRPGRRPATGGDAASTLNATSVLGGATRGNNSQDFRGGNLVAIMGGHVVDLRGARIANGPAVIDIFAFWGGVELKVPESWQVVMEGQPLLGAFEDNTHRTGTASPTHAAAATGLVDLGKGGDEPPQVLIVKGLAIMGGVDVKN